MANVHDPNQAFRLTQSEIDEWAELNVTVLTDEVVEDDESGDIEVWDQNWPAMHAFLAMETQWRVVSGFGGMIRTGLDYTALSIVLRAELDPQPVFDDIRVMERAALNLFGEVANVSE